VDIILVNIHVINIDPSNYKRQTLVDVKEQIGVTKIIGNINNPLSSMYRSSAQNINKATSELNDTIYQIYLTDIY
jgi:hypothetical protein